MRGARSFLFTAVEIECGSGYPRTGGDCWEISKRVGWSKSQTDRTCHVGRLASRPVAVSSGRRGEPAYLVHGASSSGESFRIVGFVQKKDNGKIAYSCCTVNYGYLRSGGRASAIAKREVREKKNKSP